MENHTGKKACPYCHVVSSVDAKKCSYCGSDISNVGELPPSAFENVDKPHIVKSKNMSYATTDRHVVNEEKVAILKKILPVVPCLTVFVFSVLCWIFFSLPALYSYSAYVIDEYSIFILTAKTSYLATGMICVAAFSTIWFIVGILCCNAFSHSVFYGTISNATYLAQIILSIALITMPRDSHDSLGSAPALILIFAIIALFVSNASYILAKRYGIRFAKVLR
ncbi:MAG: hypothetical protein NC132_05180 [Corallococcus sp.]|nr:hypothetical protein [Corallococcus sp.]MCM1359930.1 hypothetical protein [Corallococcus sp.]MCM1395486.1 hypothetical protein [Corallococcus sp.]